MSIPVDPPLIVDTQKVHDTGSKIASEATNQQYNDPNGAFDLKDKLEKINLSMPSVVQAAIQTFSDNYYTAFTDLLSRRIAIGHLLQDSGTQTEKTEFEAMKHFDWTLEPTSHDYYTK